MIPRSLDVAGATVQVYPDPVTASRAVADRIARVIESSTASRGRAVLGLATGKTPLAVYARLVALHKAGEVCFGAVSTYNLDEYYPISPADPQSYRSYMQRSLFDQVDLVPNRTHLFDGTVPREHVAEHAAQYDRWISSEGGLDLQLLGIGRNGHIGFNEPSSIPVDEALTLPSRLVDLHPTTLADAVADFGDASLVPQRALTLGVGPILAARSILVLAFGAKKSEIVAKALRGPVSSQVPATLLQTAGDRVCWFLDEAAATGIG